MFQVLIAQPIIQRFPLKITCIDHLGSKSFIGTTDGSILDYEIEDDPFTITLQMVHKNIIKNMNMLAILPKSKSIAILANGMVSLGDYAIQNMNAVPIERIKGATTICRSNYSHHNSDTLAIGVRRGITVFSISTYEAIESELIPVPGTPTSMQFTSESKIIVSTRRGVYLADITLKSCTEMFSFNETILASKFVYLSCSMLKPFLRVDTKKNEIVKFEAEYVYCTKESILGLTS